jgi:CheY-like chemotaxis protein
MVRALLVEDDARDRQLLTAALRMRGAQVICAASDQDAYDLMATEDVDVLIADIDLGPGTTGYDVARAFRRRSPTLPVFYVTQIESDPTPHQVRHSHVIRKGMSVVSVAETILGKMGSDPGGQDPFSGDRGGDAR